MNNDKIKQHSDSQDVLIAKIPFIGSSITTLGEVIMTIAAGLAVDVLEKSSNKGSQSLDAQSKSMQKQLDYIINELKQIKKMMK